jgi:nitronate monooxygenase
MSPSSAANGLLARLGMSTPIIQAPMAGVSTPALAAAVSNAGGLGSLGVGAMNADAARQTIRDTRALTDRPFNINLFCHAPAQADAPRYRKISGLGTVDEIRMRAFAALA